GGTGPFGESQRKFVGQNPVRGATVDYVLPQKAGRVALKIVDVVGKTVAELKATNEPGLHRATWNLQIISLPRPQGVGEAELMASPFGRAFFGTPVAIGTYRAVLTVDGQEQSIPLQIEADPNAPREAAGVRDEVEEERNLRRLEKQRAGCISDN